MRVHLAIIFSLLCCPAWAGGNWTITTSNREPGNPIPVGPLHSCGDPYPEAAAKIHAEGRTTLSFVVATDGSVKNIKVKDGSGNKDLDDASVQCVTYWRYLPVVKDAGPIELPWEAAIDWRMEDSPGIRLANECLVSRKMSAITPHAAGATQIGFHVIASGRALYANVISSSGDKVLDAAAVTCTENGFFDVSFLTVPPGGLPAHLEFDWPKVLQQSPTAAAPSTSGPPIGKN